MRSRSFSLRGGSYRNPYHHPCMPESNESIVWMQWRSASDHLICFSILLWRPRLEMGPVVCFHRVTSIFNSWQLRLESTRNRPLSLEKKTAASSSKPPRVWGRAATLSFGRRVVCRQVAERILSAGEQVLEHHRHFVNVFVVAEHFDEDAALAFAPDPTQTVVAIGAA